MSNTGSQTTITRINTRPILGEFEQVVVAAVRDKVAQPYGLALAQHLQTVYGTNLAVAQVYVTLKRLVDKGFLSFDDEDDPRPVRGGRKRRIYKVTKAGRNALRQEIERRKAILPSS